MLVTQHHQRVPRKAIGLQVSPQVSSLSPKVSLQVCKYLLNISGKVETPLQDGIRPFVIFFPYEYF